MTTEGLLTLVIAAVGAITGTVALVIQLAQHRKDKADLELSGRMSLGSNIADPVARYQFELDVVNKGRRVARIAEVYIETTKEKPGTRLMLFDARGENAVALEEGETKRFEDRLRTTSLDVWFESFADSEFFFVRLTTGEIHRTKFQTVKKSTLEKLRQQ